MVQLGFRRAMRLCQPAMLAAAVLLPSAAAPQDASAPAAAQDALPAAAPDDSKWVKVCTPDPNTKKQLCQVVQELHADTGQFIASAMIRTLAGDPKMQFIAVVPLG